MLRRAPRYAAAFALALGGCAAVPSAPPPPPDVAYPPFDARPWDAARDRPDDAGAPDAADAPATDAPATDAAACNVDAPTACPSPAPRYAEVAPIFTRRCVVCHSNDPDDPWPLDTYGHVADWQNEIRSTLLGCAMPPADGGVTLLASERDAILTWLRCGLPR